MATALSLAMPIGTQVAYADAQSELDAATEKVKEANAAYDEAVSRQNELASQIDELSASIDQKTADVTSKRQSASQAVRKAYVTDKESSNLMAAIVDSTSISEAIRTIQYYMTTSEAQVQSITELQSAISELTDEQAALQQTKAEQDQAVANAENAKVSALDAQEEARKKVSAETARKAAAAALTEQRAASSSSSSSSAESGSNNSSASTYTSDVSGNEASAKEWIAQKESGGSYTARNGRYIGRYQLSSSYLGGDYSPAHQEEVADAYVKNRYGSWSAAKAFWQRMGWY